MIMTELKIYIKKKTLLNLSLQHCSFAKPNICPQLKRSVNLTPALLSEFLNGT